VPDVELSVDLLLPKVVVSLIEPWGDIRPVSVAELIDPDEEDIESLVVSVVLEFESPHEANATVKAPIIISRFIMFKLLIKPSLINVFASK
jgi:hypothetical protein